MRCSKWIWPVLGMTSLLACFALVSTEVAGDSEGKKPFKPGKKPHVIEVDLNRLPPDLARQVRDYSQTDPPFQPKEKGKGKGKDFEPKGKGKGKDFEPKGKARALTLIEAIRVAEKQTNGQAIKAERRGEGTDAHYRIEVLDGERTMRRLELSSDGRLEQRGKGKPSAPEPIKPPKPGKPEKQPKQEEGAR